MDISIDMSQISLKDDNLLKKLEEVSRKHIDEDL